MLRLVAWLWISPAMIFFDDAEAGGQRSMLKELMQDPVACLSRNTRKKFPLLVPTAKPCSVLMFEGFDGHLWLYQRAFLPLQHNLPSWKYAKHCETGYSWSTVTSFSRLLADPFHGNINQSTVSCLGYYTWRCVKQKAARVNRSLEKAPYKGRIKRAEVAQPRE